MPAKKTKKKQARKATPRISLSQKAYDYLLEKLMTNQLAPGDLLNRREIAEELKISVAPVLEAVVQLEADGILESIPRKGTRVCGVRMEDLRGQIIIREALECAAARIYCGKRLQENQAELEVLAIKADKSSKDIRVGWNVESEFHCALVDLAGVPMLMNAFTNVMRKKLFMGIQLYQQVHPEGVRDSHIRLLDALKSASPDEAERLIRNHIRNGKEALFLDLR